MELLNPDLALPIIGALVAGAAVGVEREYRASPAGLRTHILVSLSCCLLMLSAVHQMAWLSDTPIEVIRIDPVRMAHGILTGIGFLCGGVIFREGFTVRGLTTAASLWMTATLGVIFGIGFYELALFGTIATLLVLAAVRLTERFVPKRQILHFKVAYLKGRAPSQSDFTAWLIEQGFQLINLEQETDAEGTEFYAIVEGYSLERADYVTGLLANNASVRSFRLQPESG